SGSRIPNCGQSGCWLFGHFLTKSWGVAPLRQIDHQQIALAFAQVILIQPRTQPGSLCPYDGVLFGIVIRAAPEHFHRDHRFLDLAALAVQMLLYDESQESGQTLITAET